jgi:hypothetical protein
VTELEISLVLSASLGADVSVRAGGGDWQSLYSNPTFSLGSTLTAGFGASRIDSGGKAYVSDIEVEGDLYDDVFPYVRRLEWGGIDLDRADRALDTSVGDDLDPDFAESARRLAVFFGTSLGTPPPPKAPLTTFPNGLIEQIRGRLLGPVPEFVSPEKSAKTLEKAVRFALKAQKELDKSKPNAKKARKFIAKALAAVDDTRDLLTFGRKLK